jgi:serine/threonine protein kinase
MEDQTFDQELIAENIKIFNIHEVEKIKGKKLGEGKFGKVYLGKISSYPVAIKKLKFVRMEEIDIKSIVQEIKTLQFASKLCPEVPKFFGVWKGKKGLYYNLIFEYIEGVTLRERIQKGDMKLDEKIRIIYDLAECLHFLHENKLLHRDIKPENIMIDKFYKIRLIDFGTAKLASKTITYTSSVIGTTHYLAPDNFDFSCDDGMEDKPVPHTTAVDIWSLGVMICEILSGIFPYSNITSNLQIIESHLVQQKPYPIPSQIKKNFGEFLPIIELSLKVDRKERCTAIDVKDYFKQFIK